MSFFTLNTKTKIILIALLVTFSLGIGLVVSFFVKTLMPSRSTHAEGTKIKKETEALEESKKAPEESKEEDISIPQKDTPLEKEAPSSYSGGGVVYKVGEDIQAGVYKLIPQEETAYYRISKSADIESTLDILQEDILLGSTYIKVKKGEYLLLVDATHIEGSKVQPYNPQDNIYVSGEYIVGQDIPPGTYKINPKGQVGYVQIASSPLKKDVIESQYIDKPIKITLMKGQFVRISMSDVVIED